MPFTLLEMSKTLLKLNLNLSGCCGSGTNETDALGFSITQNIIVEDWVNDDNRSHQEMEWWLGIGLTVGSADTHQ